MAKDEKGTVTPASGNSAKSPGEYELVRDAETFIRQSAMAARDVFNGTISPQQAKAGAILLERIENMVRLQLRRESESGKLGAKATGAGSAQFLLTSQKDMGK